MSDNIQRIGPVSGGTGTPVPFRADTTGASVATDAHGRFTEAASRGTLYSQGITLTALSANTVTLSATTTPIVGVWNPSTSTVNLVILQIALGCQVNNVTSVAPGGFVLAASASNSAISTGNAPFNRKTLATSGSQAKSFTPSVALTGLTNNLVVFEGLELPVSSALLTTTIAAATPTPSVAGVVNYDGGLIVPPGGVLCLLNTVSTTTHSVTARMMWEEIAINPA